MAGSFIDFTIELDGEKQFHRRMSFARKGLKTNVRRVSPDLFDVLEDETLQRFDTQGRRGGRPFKKLSPAYKRRKQALHKRNPARFPGTKIMQLTGRSLNSLVGGRGATGTDVTPDSIRRIFDDHLVYGSDVEYLSAQKASGRDVLRFGRSARSRIQEVFRLDAVGVVRVGVEGPALRGG